MNFKVIIIACVLLLIGGVCFMLFSKKKNPKELELTYKISAGIPFKWEFEIEDDSVVSFDRKYVVRNDNKGGIVGAHVYTNYVFKGLKEGDTTITFKVVSITGEYDEQVKEEHKVKVDKNLHITLLNGELGDVYG